MEPISPRVDIAFKKIFGVEENKDLLISLINAVVSKDDQVADVTLLNPYNPANFRNDKLSILDVKAKGLDGKLFNIEIQISDEADYDKRALYYWAKLYTEQLKASQDYGRLAKAIGIHILNFLSIPESKKYHNVFHIKEKDSDLRYFKDLELHTLELKKFSQDANEELPEMLGKIKSALDVWMAFLTRHDLLRNRAPKDLPGNLSSQPSFEPLQKAIQVLDVMNFSEQERGLYEDHLKWLRIEANTLKKSHEDGKAEGRLEGRLEGIEIGQAKGIEIGQAKGKQEEKIQIAKKMLQLGLELDAIVKVTGLSSEEILALK